MSDSRRRIAHITRGFICEPEIWCGCGWRGDSRGWPGHKCLVGVEVLVTPEMIQAGAAVLHQQQKHGGAHYFEDLAAMIYHVMRALEPPAGKVPGV